MHGGSFICPGPLSVSFLFSGHHEVSSCAPGTLSALWYSLRATAMEPADHRQTLLGDPQSRRQNEAFLLLRELPRGRNESSAVLGGLTVPGRDLCLAFSTHVSWYKTACNFSAENPRPLASVGACIPVLTPHTHI